MRLSKREAVLDAEDDAESLRYRDGDHCEIVITGRKFMRKQGYY
jgi:hypothetical protein